MEVRLLNLEKDLDIVQEAWTWADTAPRWFRETLAITKESWEEYLANFPNELHYGVFVEDQPTAIIRLIEAAPFIFNLHLSAKRKTDFRVLVEAGLNLRDHLFEHGIIGFYGHLPVMNRSVSKLYEALGFEDTGVRSVDGQIRGKDVEWKQYGILNPHFTTNSLLI
jgi:hypothetical protein